MNKKVLSAILFSALFAGAGTFTSCIDNDEPAGIEELRGAKAELIRAKVAVEQANAALKLAQAEVQKAEAARLESLAKINEASARLEEARAEAAEIQNEEDRAALEKTIAEYEMYLEEKALEHELTMTQNQQNLAVVKRQYELALKAIEIAEALMSEQAQVYVSELKAVVGTCLAEVERLEHAIEVQQEVLYNAAKYIGAETKFQIAQAEIALNNKKTLLEAKELEIEKYKKYLEIDPTATESDWRNEIAAIEAEVAGFDKKMAEYELEYVKAIESEEAKALAAAVTAAENAMGEIEAPKVAEDLTYAYKYFAGSQEVEGKIAKDMLMSDAVDAITGEGNTIDQLNAEKASYTNEYQAYLKALAADENLQDLDKMKAISDKAIADWTAAKANYADKKSNTKNLSYATAVTAHAAYEAALGEAGASDLYGTSGDAVKVLKAKQAYADALVAWYGTLPTDQVTFNNLTLEITTTVQGGTPRTEYITKTAKDFLSDTSMKDVYLVELVKQCFGEGNWTFFWSEAAQNTQDYTINGETVAKPQAKAVFGKWVADANAVVNEAAKAMVNASNLAFGLATNYIDSRYAATVLVDGVATAYLTVEPSESDVKRIANYATAAGALGAYLAYTDEGVTFVAKNLDAILADLDAAIEYWTAAAEDMTESVEAYEADLDAAQDAIDAATEEYNEYVGGFEDAYNDAIKSLREKVASLDRVKTALITAVDQYLAEDYDGEGSFMDYLAGQLKTAEEEIPGLVLEVEKAEVDLEAAKEGKFFTAGKVEKEQELLAKLEEDLAQALEELEKALADLATAESIWAGTAE